MKNTENKNHILIITYNDYPVYEGTGVRINNLSKVFIEKGYDVIIFAPNIDNNLVKQEYLPGCRIIRTNIYVPAFLKKNRILARAWSMLIQTFLTPLVYLKYMRKISIKFILAVHIYSIPPAIMIKVFKRTKIVVDDHPPVSDMLRNDGSLVLAKLFTLFEKFLFKFCHDFIYTSPKLETYYKKRGAISTFYIQNGVDCNEFKPTKTDENKIVIFFNGSTFSKENCVAAANFIEVGKKLIKTVGAHIEFRLICWPEYNLPPSVRNDIINEKKWLKYKNGVKDIAAEIGCADITLLPFSQDHHHVHAHGIRLKVLEYMACGKLLISTSEGVEGTPGLIPNEHFLLAQSVDDIPKVISNIIQSPDKMKKIGENARNFVLNNYDWLTTSEEFIKAYD